MKPTFLKTIICSCVLLFLGIYAQAQIAILRQKIQQIAASSEGTLGIGIKELGGKDSLTLNGKGHFATQSVYKFHLGLAVLHQVDKGKFGLDQKIFVKKSDLYPNTWSPLREKYPNGDIDVPLREILQYTVAQSDNNGCDLLFGLVGGPKMVEQYIKSIGVKDVSIKTTEQVMQSDYNIQFTNWSTPWAAVLLLEKFYQKKLLLPTTQDFMWKTMTETTTGPNKIKGLLPAGTVVAHKTGYSGTYGTGLVAATNDIGIVQLPNGKYFAIAIFYGNTRKSEAENDRVIAEVAKAAYDYFAGKR
ncbi:MAG: class A beta-lactamase, subclass A2 [Spirosomataceae bacterium]